MFPEALSAETLAALERADAYRERWRELLQGATDDELEVRRNRNFRRHAIETGIIERLYDIDWGTTEALVAEGITLDVAEREGAVSPETLDTINAQLDGLQLLVSFVNEKREFSTSFVKELHIAITRTQRFIDARDSFGHAVAVHLEHGVWKRTDNHVMLRDGSKQLYTPAIFIQDEMDRLVELYLDYQNSEIHPIALAAWLHHSFISIHPFADGNGRVARALTLLALMHGQFVPIVVRRDSREEYIDALDLANRGDLEPLIRFFARLEEQAALAELEIRPTTVATSAVEVAQEYARSLKARLEFSNTERREGAEALATDLNSKTNELLVETAAELQAVFAEIDPRADVWTDSQQPPSEKSKWWRAEIIRAAREVDFYSNMSDGVWWSKLTARVLERELHYVAVVQRVGHGETGILALTFFAESKVARRDKAGASSQTPQPFERLIRLRPSDSVTFLHTDEVEEAWGKALDAINKTLTASVASFLDASG
ncbi:Fic family protein [Agrococcus jenensis]|uniref:Fic family protein n=1 Tax=Agrococcus jenensis TaxID=46353 RepID=A0A3N2ARX5_9MICO|nr:Fic family protein [Agrococcus jenensis]